MLNYLENNLFTSTGVFKYTDHPLKLIVEVDPEIGAYYRSLLPKAYCAKPGKYPTHITVVRTGRDKPSNWEAWKKYQNQTVFFYYEPGVIIGPTYFWLRVLSKQLEEVRLELGLDLWKAPATQLFPSPPLGFRHYFHITIGNNKIA